MLLFLTKPVHNCFLSLVEILPRSCYYDVEKNSKGGTYMRKTNIDNIRWMTVVIVVIFHVFYMFNGVVFTYLHFYISLPPLAMYLLVGEKGQFVAGTLVT